ncbi:hypothetical protein V8G54_011826 [Vigna mungo]|uniref:Uncharacterized protein n=1 Tax=Vigna mungo TaxID=3915 RepID=A0AAQ3NS16_VIGMU
MRFNSVTPFKFFLHLFTLFTHLQAYTTVNHFTISCGTTGTSYDGGRTWTGDTGSMFFSNQNNTVSSNPTTPFPLIQLPYNTARAPISFASSSTQLLTLPFPIHKHPSPFIATTSLSTVSTPTHKTRKPSSESTWSTFTTVRRSTSASLPHNLTPTLSSTESRYFPSQAISITEQRVSRRDHLS